MQQSKTLNFAQLIAQFRQQRGLSQGQLAQATRLSRTYVYHLETGQRTNPSPHVVHNIARALELSHMEKFHLYEAYTQMTGQFIDAQQNDGNLLDLGDLASLLVHNTSYPAYTLNKLWYLHSWNDTATTLFETQEEVDKNEQMHLLVLVFNPMRRKKLYGWESLARRLVRDFQYNTRTITHLPEYKALWKQLREYDEFRRIASVTYPIGKPAPSFVLQLQHSTLGFLTLRTATTVFTGISSYSMVSYVPGDQQTLEVYRQLGWQSR